ncbi:hypothetical protein, partial [Trabulsiella odontotermitis]|uniref:hypothetical protein n=1 Tax=Trabulsiella odontotermitis TaxID=379893 RepID=UPI001F2469A9
CCDHCSTIIVVTNFNIENGRELSLPKWGIKGENPNFIHTEVNEILFFLITFFEEVFITCVSLLFPAFPVYTILFNDKPDEKMPIRYSLHLSLPDSFQGNSI